MWELSKHIPLGRLSMRKYLRFVPALLVACFVYILTTAPTSFAADATWSGDTILYEDNRFTGPVEAKEGDSHNIPVGSQIYGYVEEGASRSDPSIAHFIYFAPNTEPGATSSAQYVTYTFTPPDNYSNSSPPKTISLSEMGFKEEISTCAVDAVGWIVCPITSFLAKGMDWLYGALSKMLEVQPLQSNTDNALYRAWDITRNIANIAFVIAFIIFIYSYLVGGGMSNYTMKKMLPRLVVAAILVNISYWICAIGVDISNILGYSVQDLFTNIRTAVIGPLDSGKLINWESMTTFLLAGGTAVGAAGIGAFVLIGGGAGVGALFLLLPMLLIVLTAVLVAMFVMVARQAFIIILIVIAPLAFVAYLLPNTEKWFEKWRQVFMTMLLLFPIFSLIFGGSQLAGTIIIHNADSFLLILLGMGVQVAPIVITPMLVKFSGGLLGRLAGMVNNPNKGLIDRTRNWSKEKYDQDRTRRNALLNNPDRPLKKRQAFLRHAQGYQNRKRNKEGWKKGNEERAETLYHRTEGHGKVDNYNRRTEQAKRAIEGQHDAHWNQQFDQRNTRFNDQAVRREMLARTTQGQAEQAKAVTDAVYGELQGGENTTGVAALNAIRDQAQLSSKDLALTGMRKQMAERKQTEIRAGELKTDAALRTYAGGIMGQEGQLSVLATAKTTASKLFMDDVKNIQDSMDYDLKTSNNRLMTEFTTATSMAQRVAYANTMSQNGGPGVEQLEQAIHHYEGSGPATKDLLDFKELLGTNPGIRQAGKHFDDWINNSKGPAVNLQAIRSDVSTWNNMAPDKFATMNSKIQLLALNELGRNDPVARTKLVSQLLASPEKLALIKPEVKERF